METIKHYFDFLPFRVVLAKGDTHEAYIQASKKAREMGYVPVGKGFFIYNNNERIRNLHSCVHTKAS